MAWICVDLDNTLITSHTEDGMGGVMPIPPAPTEGAVEAMMQLAMEGHRLTVFTSRFAPMPDASRQQLKVEIEDTLNSMGFPPLEVWFGTSKPAADVFIDSHGVTFDGDWGLVLAQTQIMMEERGLVPSPMGMPFDQGLDTGGPPEMSPEEQFVADEPKPKEDKKPAKKVKKND